MPPCKPSYPWCDFWLSSYGLCYLCCGPLVVWLWALLPLLWAFGCLAMGVVTFVVGICFIFEL
jgi:hypothetical protein